MAETTNKPVLFLAFANDRDDTVGYLRNLPDETRRLREVLERAEQAKLCEVVIRSNSTASDIFKVFQNPKFRNRIAILHYGGHANGYQLLLESPEGKTAAADAGGLAAFLAQQRGLQLVFLNGCSTQPQTQELLDANISMVISTSRSIDDKVATDFACRFYQGLAGNATIRTAYEEAATSVRTAKGGNTRDLYFGDKDDPKSQLEADRWPWNLYVREGSENADQWNLPDAANDPLAGLPPLPLQDLPERPYRQLAWFERKHADVFFGRGHQIRNLYNQLTVPRTAPIILFYGQSGVGKSSLLDAGLIPRLERDYEVRYRRRDQQQGLIGTLRSAILPEACDVPIETAWREKEQQLGKPLIVFLDQVEETYTRHYADTSPDDELNRLLEVLKATFVGSDNRPRGKLVLGFRKEWLAELDGKMKAFELPRKQLFLEPLSRRGIIEVVRGPARSERLRDHYGLEVDDGLAEIIADDLLEDYDSAVAPTLQILLTKMWETAKDENYEHPHFSQQLYNRLKRDGILLRDFLDQQIATFGKEFPNAVKSGLLLDILALHTTPLGTADQCTVERLKQQYAHLGAALPDLLQKCQSLYLLTIPTGTQKESSKATRLAHDTLAPLIRERFDQSDKPGQRARRILDNRSVEWRQGGVGTPIDEHDLADVEHGKDGTRDWNDDEKRLIEASRQRREELEQHAQEELERSKEIRRLSDSRRLRSLRNRADELWPAHPELCDAYCQWIEKSQALTDGISEHERTLEALRSRGKKCDLQEYRFEDENDAWWYETLNDLVTDLYCLTDPECGLIFGEIDPRHGWGIRRRLDFARTVEDKTISNVEAQKRWKWAIREIGESERYGGLRLKPQLGLVPLGPNPNSGGLWEFGHLQTGELPRRSAAAGSLELTDEDGLVFVLIPGGKFRMGSQSSDPTALDYDPSAEPDETPHEVVLSPFFMSKYQMTQGQWQRFTGHNPSRFQPGCPFRNERCTLLHPVEQVSWLDCTRILDRLGLLLPTEAQWEYAARAGTKTPWATGAGKASLSDAANLADQTYKDHGALSDTPCEPWRDGYAAHAPVGSFRPNDWGLYDVHGNVWEWCRDAYGSYELDVDEKSGERQVTVGRTRIFRGGSFYRGALSARSALRRHNSPEHKIDYLGVRPARAIED